MRGLVAARLLLTAGLPGFTGDEAPDGEVLASHGYAVASVNANQATDLMFQRSETS